MKKEIREWTKWTHKKNEITMEVSKVWRGKVNLWDKPMRFRWTGTEAEFRREWRPANPTGLRCAGLGAHKQDPVVGAKMNKENT